MQNVVRLPVAAAEAGPVASAAQHYRFVGDPASALRDETFLQKAAAFQEIRDCLAAADRREMQPREAERRIAFLVRAYLGSDR